MLKTVSTQLALASDTLSEILAKDNTSGPYNIAMDSGYGIDFSATPGTGTSELLDDYEEGTWTPTDVSGAGLSFTSVTGNYRKVGGIIFANFTLLFPATSDATIIQIGTLPYSSSFNNGSGGTATYTDYNSFLMLSMSTTLFRVYGGTGASIQNATLSGKYLEGFLVYPA